MAVVYRFRFRVRRRTTANWGSSNEVLLDSEIGRESDLLHRTKMGNGVTGWNSLLFYTPGLYDLTGIADGYSLFWDASAGNWIVGPPGGGGGGSSTAQDVSFEPSSSTNLVATNVQDAIEELENDRLTAEAALQAAIDDSKVGGILIQGGSEDLDDALSTGFAVKGISAADYTITGWELWVEPLGSLQLDILKSTFGSIPPVTSIVAAAPPSVTAAMTNSSSSLTGWTTAISRSDALSVSITSNTGVKWFALLLKGTRT